MKAWSYSSLKTFQQCPRKYYHLKIAKDVVDRPHESALYGSAVHTAAEVHIRDGEPVPAKFSFMAPTLEVLNNIPGTKHCEIKLGLTEELEPCEFSSPKAWWHGIVDLLITDESNGTAHMVDYKTSKNARYADTKQLDYMAVAVFAKFPEIKTIKSALLFVVSSELVKKKHIAEKKQEYIDSAMADLHKIESALDNGVWNPKSGPLCGFCPVRTCEYNRN
jgi:hypothetical protein